MTDSAALGIGIDVFIVFSKKVPGEAKLALEVKDQLEQLGLQPLEYEHWTWLTAGTESSNAPEVDEAWGGDVDRAQLRRLFNGSAAVVYIAPLAGDASAGVEVELEELRGCGSPTLLIYWSPHGWHPLLEPDKVSGLNLVWRTEARSAGKTDIAHNQAEHVARQVAGACWLASVLASLPRDGMIRPSLAAVAPNPHTTDALLLFRLTGAVDVDATPEGDVDPDPEESGRRCARECGREELVAFSRTWRNGTDLMTEELANELSYGVGRSMRALHGFCEALCRAATDGFPDVAQLPWKDQLDRALMLVRLNRNDEAAVLLAETLPDVPDENLAQAEQILALAKDDVSTTTIDGLARQIARETDRSQKALLIYTLGRERLIQEAWADAVEDFTTVIELGGNLSLSALLGRARCYARLERDDEAIADFDYILRDPLAAPRLSASAWLDRGGLLWKLGRLDEATADWGEVIRIADASPRQRFLALDARGQVLEELGRWRLAADDYEAMTAYSAMDNDSRSALRLKVDDLRRRATSQQPDR